MLLSLLDLKQRTQVRQHAMTMPPKNTAPLTEEPTSSVNNRINGLLYLPALGLLLSLFFASRDLFELAGWVIQSAQKPALLSYVSGGLALMAINLLFCLITCVLFFGKKRLLRKVIILFYLFGIAYAAYFTLVPAYLFAIEITNDDIKIMVQAILTSRIWIPYFILSKRVPQVFTQ